MDFIKFYYETNVRQKVGLSDKLARHINAVFVSVDDKSVAIYPNPVQDELTISEGVGMITIFNARGQPVKQIINESETIFAIDVRDLPQGIYSLQLRKANGEVVTTQFVK